MKTIKFGDLLREATGDKTYDVTLYRKEDRYKNNAYKDLKIKAKSLSEAKLKVRKKYPPSIFRYEWTNTWTEV